MKTELHWHENRHVEQWYRIVYPEISPHNNGCLILENLKIYTREDRFWDIWASTFRRIKLGPCISPCETLTTNEPNYSV